MQFCNQVSVSLEEKIYFSYLDKIRCTGRVIFNMNKITLRQLAALMKSKVIAFVIWNVLLLFIAVYGLWGAFWIWQPGADPPQWVPLFGVQSYLQSIENRGYIATLVYGVLTYRVDIWSGGVQKLGVTRLDWTQLSLIILAFLDCWTLIDFLRSRKTRKSSSRKS
jgi:hypothetical protein